MHADIAAIVHRLLAEDPYGVAPHLQTKIIFADARHFDNCDEITCLPKDIDWREPAWPRSDVFEPVAFELLIERTLNAQESIERIRKTYSHLHVSSPLSLCPQAAVQSLPAPNGVR